jgi:polyisoprenoid-binding protein YceI
LEELEMNTQTTAETGTAWTIDPTHSQVEFAVRHLMISTVRGHLPAFTGTLELDVANPAAAEVAVAFDAASIDTRNAERDTHLRSADFLDVEHHPEITFRSTRAGVASLAEGGEFTLEGELTIRGVSRPVTLQVTTTGRTRDPWGGERLAFAAHGAFDRRDFGLTWNAALETGGVMVSDEVKVTIDLQVVRT